MRSFCYPCLWAGAFWLGVASTAHAEVALQQEPQEAQEEHSQAELQIDMDAVDDESRAMLEELLELERDERRLARDNAALAPRLERQAEALARREAALDALPDTREVLPALQERLVERLASWIESDMPFLHEERKARVASLRDSTPHLTPAERWERVVTAWRTELDYGREVDAWRGYLGEGAERREVDYLRLGRIGFYYLTPDGRDAGVWDAKEGRWAALDEAQRSEVRNGLRIARDRRAPELLTLPVSQPLKRAGEGDA